MNINNTTITHVFDSLVKSVDGGGDGGGVLELTL